MYFSGTSTSSKQPSRLCANSTRWWAFVGFGKRGLLQWSRCDCSSRYWKRNGKRVERSSQRWSVSNEFGRLCTCESFKFIQLILFEFRLARTRALRRMVVSLPQKRLQKLSVSFLRFFKCLWLRELSIVVRKWSQRVFVSTIGLHLLDWQLLRLNCLSSSLFSNWVQAIHRLLLRSCVILWLKRYSNLMDICYWMV